MAKVNVVSLGRATAIDTIINEESVFMQKGVWNKYSETDTKTAIDSIEKSGYGADVYFDEETKKYYVSIPSSSDMW